MTYTHCQNCGARRPDNAFAKCPQCGWRPGDGLKWLDDTHDPARVKACYDYCQDVDTALLMPGGLKRLRNAYAELLLKIDVMTKDAQS